MTRLFRRFMTRGVLTTDVAVGVQLQYLPYFVDHRRFQMRVRVATINNFTLRLRMGHRVISAYTAMARHD